MALSILVILVTYRRAVRHLLVLAGRRAGKDRFFSATWRKSRPIYAMIIPPTIDKIAYVVIARGGIFGFDDKYVPVPWEAFKITPNVKLLVLDTTKDVLDER